MNIALDTNRYDDFIRGRSQAGETIAIATEIHLPLPVLAELRAGFLLGTRRSENERQLRAFLNKPRVHLLLPDEQTSHEYAKLYVQMRAQGTPVPHNDLWIAALVSQHNLVLYSRDKHFDHFPQLARV